MLTVVKIGGGVGAEALRPLCATVAELAARHPLLVVPGGAGFADAVREADRRFGLQPGTAHRMAILGMEQFGWLLGDLIPGAVRTAELRVTPGRATVLLPAALPLDLPESWDVTSDSIAAWVAGRIGAGRLVFVKHDTRRGVDSYLPTVLERARFETRVVGPDRLGTLPWKNG